MKPRADAPNQFRNTPSKHLGALSELAATKWLLLKGYEIFRNISQHGLADIVAWMPGQAPILIDVKTLSFSIRENGDLRVISRPASAEQEKAGVKVLYVCRVTGAAGFSLEEVFQSIGVEAQRGGGGAAIIPLEQGPAEMRAGWEMTTERRAKAAERHRKWRSDDRAK